MSVIYWDKSEILNGLATFKISLEIYRSIVYLSLRKN